MDFWKYENQNPKTHSNCAQNDVDLWIFGNKKIKTQKVIVTVHKTLGICGFLLLTYTRALSDKKHILRKLMWICVFLNGGLSIGKSLVAQNDVDFWISGNMKIRTLKLIVTVRKTLWICGFLLLTYTSALLAKKTLIAQINVDLWILKMNRLKNSHKPDAKHSGLVDSYILGILMINH